MVVMFMKIPKLSSVISSFYSKQQLFSYRMAEKARSMKLIPQ
jgi:hypothetical protein